MRRAENFNVKSVSVVLPIIERRGGEHGKAAPGGDESPQRTVKTPDLDGRTAGGKVAAKGCAQNKVSASDADQHTVHVDGQMRRGPKRIAANGHMPGDVPVTADHGGNYSRDCAPDIPGNGRRFRRSLPGHPGLHGRWERDAICHVGTPPTLTSPNRASRFPR